MQELLAFFLKRVIRGCLSNDFRHHNLQIVIVMLIYSVTFMYFFQILLLYYVCSITFGSFGSYEH